MAFIMNEYDVEEALDLFPEDETPNLLAGARLLYRLVRWTNAHSDGWPYWSKPSTASVRLQTLLHDHTYAARFGYYQGTAERLHDVSEADLAATLRPIKAFLTRQGVAHSEVFPS